MAFPKITPAAIGKALNDGRAYRSDWLRNGVPLDVRQRENERRFRQANPANDRDFTKGFKHRHYRIGAHPRIPAGQFAIMVVVAAFIGACLAVTI